MELLSRDIVVHYVLYDPCIFNLHPIFLRQKCYACRQKSLLEGWDYSISFKTALGS